MECRYYADWTKNPARALSPDDAKRLTSYARGWLRPDGSVERLELYDAGKIVRVDHYDAGSDDEIASRHAAMYPDTIRLYTELSVESVTTSGLRS
jgi:hypothetical protein